MPDKTARIKIPEDIEYKAIGSFFCLLIACGGLLAGVMMTERSIAYWRDDLALLLIAFFALFSLLRNLTSTLVMAAVQSQPHLHHHVRKGPARPHADSVQPEQAAVAQIGAKATAGMSDEKVVDAVLKRIETQKATAKKKSGVK